jgi:hypothetical protein
MKTAMKIMGGVLIATSAGLVCYTMLNKKTRKKASELADAMIEEAKAMMK